MGRKVPPSEVYPGKPSRGVQSRYCQLHTGVAPALTSGVRGRRPRQLKPGRKLQSGLPGKAQHGSLSGGCHSPGSKASPLWASAFPEHHREVSWDGL